MKIDATIEAEIRSSDDGDRVAIECRADKVVLHFEDLHGTLRRLDLSYEELERLANAAKHIRSGIEHAIMLEAK